MKIEQRKCHGYDYAVFYIPINGGMVYMKQRLQSSDEDCYFVILVDRFRFESVWFKGGSGVAPELARGNEKAWRKDYKFHHAERGFSHGIENPVPLAIMPNYDYPRIGFTDGITRTVWLLANGAKSFPVFAFNKETAEQLHQYIGVKDSNIFSNNELIVHLNDGFFRK